MLTTFLTLTHVSFAAHPSPRAVYARFESLVEARKYDSARGLCRGQALRMFDLMVQAEEKIAPLLDSSASTEAVLAEQEGDRGAWLKVRSRVVFKKTFMGLTELTSWLAVHFAREPAGWKISEFEELADENARVHLREQVAVEETGQGAPSTTADSAYPFPVSPRMPAPGTPVRVARYLVSLGGTRPLEEMLTHPPFQKIITRNSPRTAIVEYRSLGFPGAVEDTAGRERFLGTTPYFQTGDSLLRRLADSLAQGHSESETAQAMLQWVSGHMKFRYGAVLFGSSSQVLRNLQGDCSEAAILTVALLRARGIPARVSLGLASTGSGLFMGHAWTEALVKGRWISLDAALGQAPADARRIKLASLDGASDLRIAATNLMLEIIFNTRVEMLEARDGKGALPLRPSETPPGAGGDFFRNLLENLAAP